MELPSFACTESIGLPIVCFPAWNWVQSGFIEIRDLKFFRKLIGIQCNCAQLSIQREKFRTQMKMNAKLALLIYLLSVKLTHLPY